MKTGLKADQWVTGKAVWRSQRSIGNGQDDRCIHHPECGDGLGGLYTQNSSGLTLEVCAVYCESKMLPRLCLGERLVLKVHLCGQKQNSWVLYVWSPLGRGVKEEKKTCTSQRPLRLSGATLSTALSTSSCLPCTGSNFPLVSSAKRLCSLSLFYLYLQKSKGTFFLSQKLIRKQGRAHRMSRQPCEGVPAQCWAVPGPGQNLWDPLKPTKGCKHLSHVTYVWLPTSHIHHDKNYKKKISFEK